jgi:hypothetical protein
MSETPNLPNEPEGAEDFGDRKGLIIGVVLGLVILGGIAALVGHRDVLSMGGRLLGYLGMK